MAQKKKGKKVIAKATKVKKRKTQYGTHVSIKGKVKRKKNPEQYVVVIDKGLTKQYVNVVQRNKVGVVHDKRDAMMFKSKRGAENVANALKEIGLVARAIPAAELPNVDNGPGFHAMEGGGVVASGARATSIFRILTLKSALKLEIAGLKMTRGTSAAQIIRNEFGWKTRDKKKLLEQLEAWIAIHLKPEEERQKMSMMGNLPVQTREDNPNRNTATGAKSTRWEDLWAVAHNVATPMQFINAWKADTNAKLRHAIGEKHWDTLIAEENSMYRPSNFRALKRKAINLLAETHGVELLGIHKRSGQLAYYLNAGDTYATTIIFIGGRMTIGSWGDAIESGTVKEISNDDLLRYRE